MTHTRVSRSIYCNACLNLSNTPPVSLHRPTSTFCIIPGMDSVPSASLKTPSADEILEGNSGTALQSEGLTWISLLAGVAYALVLYAVQAALFLFLRPRLPRV